jgi:hypothetical protein
MSDKYNIEDIINFSATENPLNVKQAVDSLMLSKIHAAIEGKKREVAMSMFGGEGKEEAGWDDEKWEDDEEDEIEDDEEFDISDDDLDDLLSDLDDIDDVDLEDDETSDSEEK